MPLFFWIFGAFVYLKFATQFALYDGVNLIANIVASITFGLIYLLSSGFYAVNHATTMIEIRYGRAGPWPLVVRNLPILIVNMIVAYISLRIVIFAFDNDLSSDVEFFGWRGRISEEGIAFIIISIIPMIAHWLLGLVPAFLEKRIQDQADKHNGNQDESK